MNRRGFFKALGAAAGGLLLKETEMQIGDSFARLGRGEILTTGEINDLRLEMNRLQAAVGRLDTIMDPRGGLAHNVFENSRGFSVLPHEAASLYNQTEQTIPTTTWTTLVGDATSGATWSRGLVIDPATGTIYTTGIPGQTVLFIHAHVYWKNDMNGTKVGIQWIANDGSNLEDTQVIPTAVTDVSFRQEIDHIRAHPATQTSYTIRAAQYSGGDQVVDRFLFTVIRLR